MLYPPSGLSSMGTAGCPRRPRSTSPRTITPCSSSPLSSTETVCGAKPLRRARSALGKPPCRRMSARRALSFFRRILACCEDLRGTFRRKGLLVVLVTSYPPRQSRCRCYTLLRVTDTLNYDCTSYIYL